jgi:hypothetical protein
MIRTREEPKYAAGNLPPPPPPPGDVDVSPTGVSRSHPDSVEALPPSLALKDFKKSVKDTG